MVKAGAFFRKALFLLCVSLILLFFSSGLSVYAAVGNIAMNKSYTSSVPASNDYQDSNNRELTDGVYGSATITDAQWQGRQNVGSYTQTVDFGDNCYITDVSCRFLAEQRYGIYHPASVAFSCSNDGVTFTEMGTATKNIVSTGIAEYSLVLQNAMRTRYIKMTVTTAGDWTFADEFEANGISDSALNIAQTKRYESSSSADSSYPDTYLKELTNGKYASDSFTDTEWQGHLGSYTVTLDLGTKMRITGMNMNFLKYAGGGVEYPSNVSFEYSDDNSTFTAAGNANSQSDVNNTQKYTVTLSQPVNTRYIKVNIKAATSKAWVFTDELQVLGYPVISGSFIQLSYGDTWTQSEWEEEFDYMKDLGMDHVILQWIVSFSSSYKEVYYNSPAYNASTGYINRTNQDTLLNVLNAAERKGIDVWVGLGLNEEWWDDDNVTSQAWLNSEAQADKNIIKEIWNSSAGYKNKRSLKGWYSAWEIENYRFKERANQEKLRTALKTVVDYAHSYTGKPIMTSPYKGGYSDGLTPSGWTDMWTYILNPQDGANFDVVAPQDNFGNITDTYLAAMKKAVDTNPKCELWSNCETYNPDTESAEPTITMLNQINSEIPYVSKMTSFSYLHYHSPKVVGWAENDDWKRIIYPRLGKKYTGPAMGYENKAAGKSYTASVPAVTTYPDTDGKELTNKKYADSVGCMEDPYQGRQNVNSYKFVVDLQSKTSFSSASINFIQELENGVVFPESVTYYVSSDGVNYTSIGTVNKPADALNVDQNHYQLDLDDAVTGRYVKFTVNTGTTAWTFCDELEVIGAK